MGKYALLEEIVTHRFLWDIEKIRKHYDKLYDNCMSSLDDNSLIFNSQNDVEDELLSIEGRPI
jgi:hypothetical protein